MNKLYREILEECDKAFLYKYPHYVVPGHNLRGTDNIKRETSFCEYPYRCRQTLPFLPPAKISMLDENGGDPITDIVKQKALWNHEVNLYERKWKRKKERREVQKSLKEFMSSDNSIASIPNEPGRYVNVVASNPDTEFRRDRILGPMVTTVKLWPNDYNWYLSGGCLDQLEVDGKVCLLNTQGKKRNQLGIIPLEEKETWHTSSSSTISLQSCLDTIYQIRGKCIQNKGFVGVRQHNVCQLFSVKSNLQLRRVQKTTSNIPFTGFDFNPRIAGRYCTVTTKRCVEEWDMNVRVYANTVASKEVLPDNWSSIAYSQDSYSIMMTDRCCTYFLDPRNELRKPSVLICPKKMPHILECCEVLSLVFQSCIQPHCFYICTSHHVLLYDIRNGLKPLQSWTHLLRSMPLYSSVTSPGSGQEILCIGNQEPGEIVSVYNCSDFDIPLSHVAPFSIPNLHDTLNAAHRQGVWLDPFTQCRVKLSLTGLVMLPPHSSRLTILSQTASGDVFSHVLEKKSDELEVCFGGTGETNFNGNSDYLESSDLKCLKKWEKQLLKIKSSSVFQGTKRKKMNETYRRLK